MGNCIDPRFEPMIHAYELGTLSDEDRQALELHMLECESCFEAVRGFEKTSRMLKTDPDVRALVAEMVDSEPSVRSLGKGSRPEKDNRRLPRWVPVTVVAAAAVLLIILKPWHIEIHPTDEVVAAENRLVIIPFENLAEPDDDGHLGRIIASLLVSDLAESEFIDVVSSQHLADVIRLISLDDTSVNRAELLEKVSGKVGARWQLTGSIVQTEPQMVLVIELLDAGTDSLLASSRITGEPGQDVFALVDLLTVEIRKSLPLPLSATSEQDPRVAEVTTHSPDAYRFYLEGLDAYSRMYVDDARMNFRRALEFDSTFAMAHFRLTLCLPSSERSESIARAVRYSNGISQREQLLIEALNASIGGDYDLYIEKLRAIVEKHPNEKEVVYWLGTYYFSVGEYEQAIEYLKRAVEIDPLYKNPYNSLAYAYGRTGDTVNSIKAINRYIELAPGEANPYDSRGDLYLLSGNTEKALESFRKAEEIRRDFADYSPLTKIGRLYLLDHRYEEAREIFQELAGAENESTRACGRFMLAYIPVRQGKFDRALEILDRAISADMMEHAHERYATNHLHKAMIYEQIGQLDLAVREMELSHRIYDEVYEIAVPSSEPVRVYFLARNGELDRASTAAETAKQVLEQQGDNLQLYWLAMGGLRLVEGDAPAAVEYIEKVSQGYAFSFATNYLLGRAYLAAGRLEEAATTLAGLHSYYESGRTFWGTWDINSHYYLAITYESLNRTADAIEQYEIFLDFWKDADRELVEIEDATTRLARLKSPG